MSKRLPFLPQALYPLLAAGLAATALHGLFLSYLQLRRSRLPPSPAELRSRDNTPELLQFSTQPVPLSSLETIPLPKASILPPPPTVDLLRPLGKREEAAAPSAKKRAGRQRTAPFRPVVSRRPSPPTVRTSSPGTSSGIREGSLADAVELLRRNSQGSSPSDQHQEPSPREDSQTSPPQGVSEWTADQQQALQDLWSKATPLRPSSVHGVNQSGPEGIEIRQVSLKLGQQSNLPIRHRQSVVLNERIILFWLDGTTLWLLQTGPEPLASE